MYRILKGDEAREALGRLREGDQYRAGYATELNAEQMYADLAIWWTDDRQREDTLPVEFVGRNGSLSKNGQKTIRVASYLHGYRYELTIEDPENTPCVFRR